MMLQRIRFFAATMATLGVLFSACAAPPNSLTSEGRTSTAIVARKATDQVQMQGTLNAAAKATAAGQNTATAAAPRAAPLCSANDLSGQVEAQGATGSMTFSLKLTNSGQAPCALQGPPDVRLVNRDGQPLDVQSYLNCTLCSQPGDTYQNPGATQQLLALTQTATAQEILTGKVMLQPGGYASLFLIWNNFCDQFPEGGVSLLVKLPDSSGRLVLPSEARTGGRCDSPVSPSTLIVSQYQP